MFFEQLTQFVTQHWLLSIAFVVVLLLVIFEEARSRAGGGNSLTPQKATYLINRENAVVVDIRDANAFHNGHIIGAINIPKEDVSNQLKRLEKYKKRPIIVVCTAGQTATQAANTLKKAGFEGAQCLTGGLNAWKAAEYPTVKGK